MNMACEKPSIKKSTSPSYSYAIFNNMFWSTVESSLQYAATGWMNDGGYSWSGFGGAALGGFLGGVIPGYQAVPGGSMVNIFSETAYSAARGGVLGYVGGGLGEVLRTGSWNNEAAISGAGYGVLGGVISSTVKIGLLGYAVPKSDFQKEIEANYAKEHNLIIGPYGSVNRRGGLLDVVGVSIGRNNVSNPEKKRMLTAPTHEGIHYLQQVKDGTLPFYLRVAQEYKFGTDMKSAYTKVGTYDYEADDYSLDYYYTGKKAYH